MYSFKQYGNIQELQYDDLVVEEAEYEGRKVKLNDPFRLPSGSKRKFAVYVKNDKGNVVKVQFGDPNMEIKRDDPGARKSFRARHGCDVDPGQSGKRNIGPAISGEQAQKLITDK